MYARALDANTHIFHRSHRAVQPARDNVPEISQVGRVIESKPVGGDPAGDMHPNCANLGLALRRMIDPDSRRSGFTAAFDAEMGQRPQDRFFHSTHVGHHVAFPFSQIDDRIPDHLPRASACVEETAAMIERLLELKVAYRHGGNVYFDPLKFPGFGKLYGLDMSHWPSRRRRFHRDTYPGIQWNLGDFILWHGYREGDTVFWDTRIGRGRPSWNIQDPSIVASYFQETLSIYCGGIDNLYRHHDYSLAIIESIRPYPMARFWLHGHHLLVGGRKMSKSRGTVITTDDLIARGYDAAEIRFFLIYGHYRESLSYTDGAMELASEQLRHLRTQVCEIAKRAGRAAPLADDQARRIGETFRNRMDEDMDVRGAFDGISRELEAIKSEELQPGAAAAVISIIREIDGVLKVIL